eukprot:s1821_g3.t1
MRARSGILLSPRKCFDYTIALIERISRDYSMQFKLELKAALSLADIAEVAGSSNRSGLQEVFEKLARDEQDSVRILAINNCITLERLEALGSRKLGFAMAEIDLAEIIKDVLQQHREEQQKHLEQWLHSVESCLNPQR